MLTSKELSQLDPKLLTGEPHFWPNPSRQPAELAFGSAPSPRSLVDDAASQWREFAPLLIKLFPELESSNGEIASPLLDLTGDTATGDPHALIKADHLLPLTGTIKARGGLFEVLGYAKRNAIEHSFLQPNQSLERLADPDVKAHFGRFRISTGSTGNLGYSVGLAARALGFQVEIHMSADAKSWKVERLRALGVTVIQHPGDFTAAVAVARESSQQDNAYFIDDEDSLTLFQGYSAAAIELADQLAAIKVDVSADRRLIVYLPCGVGGSPGGVAFGLKHIFGDNVYCVFVEPVAAPSVLLQVAVGDAKPISVYDVGLDNQTLADGMAVPAASLLAVRHIQHLVDAFATVDDASLLRRTRELWNAHHLRLEPSAVAGYEAFRALRDDPRRPGFYERASHLIWTTGGSHLPDIEFERLLFQADIHPDLRRKHI
ncbi:MAG TPA: D-serine ammonia-lyase [Ensifer sp.]|nr:D-serine ammonia-lyase [Ensifer sp.]